MRREGSSVHCPRICPASALETGGLSVTNKCAIGILLQLGFAWNSFAQDADVVASLHGRAAKANQCYFAVVVSDCIVVPNAPSAQGSHRVLTVKPVYALKGELPNGPVRIAHSPAVGFPNARGEIAGYYPDHLREMFIPGSVYFLAVNMDAEGRPAFAGATEGNFRLDDPMGHTRREVADAFAKAQVPLKADWQKELDTEIAKVLLSAECEPSFEEWVGDAKLLLPLRVESLGVKESEQATSPAVLPEDFHNEIMRNLRERDYRAVAANWHILALRRMTWNSERLALLFAVTDKKKAKPWVIEAKCSLAAEAILLDDRAVCPEGQDIVIKLAFGCDADSLRNLDLAKTPLGEDRVLLVPAKRADDKEGLYEACGKPFIAEAKKTDLVVQNCRTNAARVCQMKFLDRLCKALKPPSDADREAAKRILGMRVAPGKDGYTKMVRHWYGLRPQFLSKPPLVELLGE
jgi:hypothetical protein